MSWMTSWILFIHHTLYLHDNRSPDDVIHGPVVKRLLDVEVKVLLVGADGPHQLGDVVWVQRAGLRWQATGQVCVADMGYTLIKKGNESIQIHFKTVYYKRGCHLRESWPCAPSALRVLWSQCFLRPQQPSPPPQTHPSCSRSSVWWSRWVPAFLQCHNGHAHTLNTEPRRHNHHGQMQCSKTEYLNQKLVNGFTCYFVGFIVLYFTHSFFHNVQ